MTPPICVSIMVDSIKDALHLAKKAEGAGAAMIEYRLDKNQNENVDKLANCVKLPTIATLRKPSEGGYYQGTEKRRGEILDFLSTKNFRYIDIELSTSRIKKHVDIIKGNGRKVIVSHHNFRDTYGRIELEKILRKQMKFNADICKIITKANSWKDNITILKFISTIPEYTKIVSFAMGEYGVPSRILSPLFGGAFTFASIHHNNRTALGQISFQEMIKIYRRIIP